MISTQLGRAILSGSVSTPDEMNGRPESDGSYGPLDDLIEGIADQARGQAAPAKDDTSPKSA